LIIQKKNRIVGLDEAGRGSIMGSLVIGGIQVDDDGVKSLSEMGVKDSKLLSVANRERYFLMIKKIAHRVIVNKIPPEEIDKVVKYGKKYRKLNYLEAIKMGDMVNDFEPDIVYVDASDTNPERFGNDILSRMNREIKIISVHHADKIYPIVSAASIIAKCERDKEISELCSLHGDFGSGYPSDPRTIKFLKDWLSSKGDKPSFSRKSWKTWDKIHSKSIEEF
jgi:ribonuclease HII